jgi:hypothetical protein
MLEGVTVCPVEAEEAIHVAETLFSTTESGVMHHRGPAHRTLIGIHALLPRCIKLIHKHGDCTDETYVK